MRKIVQKWRGILRNGKQLSVLALGLFVLGWGIISWRQYFRDTSVMVPSDGGILTEATIGTIKNFNPLAADVTPFDRELQKLLFSGLLEYDPMSGQIGPGLGTFRLSDNLRTYTVTLKNSAKFSNGDSVTLDDILFTFVDVIKNPNFSNRSLKAAFEYVELEVINERTLTFTLPEPNAFFPGLLTTPILQAKKYRGALIEEVTDPDYPANKYPVGTGPFRLKNVVPEDDGSFRIFLDRNRFYVKGAPLIESFVLYVYPSFAHVTVAEPWTTLITKISAENLLDFEATLFGQYEKREYVLPRTLGIYFNLDRDLPASPHLRSALSESVDKNKAFGGSLGWNRIDSFYFFEGVTDWHEPDFTSARKRLANKGFKYDEGRKIRIYEDEPVKLTMITTTNPPIYSRVGNSLAQAWRRELNIDVELQVLTVGEFQTALKDRAYDIALFGQDFSENFDTVSMWHSTESGQLNLSNLTGEAVDYLVDEIRFSGAKTDLFQLNQTLAEIEPALPLATPQYYIFVNTELDGFSEGFGKLRHHADKYSGIQNWYFFTERAWDLGPGESKIRGFFTWLFSGDDSDTPESEDAEKNPEIDPAEFGTPNGADESAE